MRRFFKWLFRRKSGVAVSNKMPAASGTLAAQKVRGRIYEHD